MAPASDTAPPARKVGGEATFADSVGLAIIAAGRRAQQLYDAELAELGLTMRHLGALGHLSHAPDMSISDLARRRGVTAQSMHATVRGLEERGAIVVDELGRGRPVKVTVTPQGRALLDGAREAAGRLDEQLVEWLGADGVHALREVLTPLTPTRTN